MEWQQLYKLYKGKDSPYGLPPGVTKPSMLSRMIFLLPKLGALWAPNIRLFVMGMRLCEHSTRHFFAVLFPLFCIL